MLAVEIQKLLEKKQKNERLFLESATVSSNTGTGTDGFCYLRTELG